MTLKEVSRLRLGSQKISGTGLATAKAIVAWMGAMQAQDFPMAKWAVGLRLQHAPEDLIMTAFNQGDIIRTHVLRPTWHLVSADDVGWMLELTAPRIKRGMSSRDRELELTDAVFTRSSRTIEKALAREGSLTRSELARELDHAKIATGGNRLSHILSRAELDGITCSGPQKGLQQTYCLLAERIPKPRKLTRDEALAQLAMRYFSSRGPATISDFRWWSGLAAGEASQALALIKGNLISETVGSEVLWFAPPQAKAAPHGASIHLLPAYDEFLIAYTKRDASLLWTDNRKTVSTNGVFYPIVVADGQVCGVWKRICKKADMTLRVDYFLPPDAAWQPGFEKAARAMARFLGKEIKVARLER
jgi:hypothetical protein